MDFWEFLKYGVMDFWGLLYAGETTMEFWKIIYLIIIAYCLPLLCLASTLTYVRNITLLSKLSKWWQFLCGIAVMEIALLYIGSFIVILTPVMILQLFGAPISAQLIILVMLILSYGCAFFSICTKDESHVACFFGL